MAFVLKAKIAKLLNYLNCANYRMSKYAVISYPFVLFSCTVYKYSILEIIDIDSSSYS